MTENAPIKLIIVDDHPIVREGMKSLVAGTPDMTIVAETPSGIEAIRMRVRCLSVSCCWISR
jgi:DNA-binding NarL/FixJ family response regulator